MLLLRLLLLLLLTAGAGSWMSPRFGDMAFGVLGKEEYPEGIMLPLEGGDELRGLEEEEEEGQATKARMMKRVFIPLLWIRIVCLLMLLLLL